MKIATISHGYGGSRFPGNTLQMLKTTHHHDNPQRLIEAMAAINDQCKRAMERKVAVAVGGDLRGKTITIFGITFKLNTDDMREAPSLSIVQALQDGGTSGADTLVTEWDAFRAFDFPRIKTIMAVPVLIDLCNVHKVIDMSRYRFAYRSVGREN